MARRTKLGVAVTIAGVAALVLLWWQSSVSTTPLKEVTASAASGREPPKGKNRLIFESSPYLLQHASNPVDWYPWGEEAFARARKEGKPIFLSIGYSTCYWCHVMERESFADPETAALMNKYFVSIKVDREERPDVDEIYMTAVQMMTGRGGWPMTVLLTPDLKPFFSGTYIPKPQLQQLLAGAHQAWTEQRDQIEQHAQGIAGHLQQATALPGKPAASLPALARVKSAAAQYAQAFDQFYGGFGNAPKFPQPSILELLLTHHEINKDRKSLEMVTQTLDAMARGGIHDQIGGGFHRYSTDDQWLVPHFEKMLYDNAQLLHVYARAHKMTGNADFKRVAEDIVDYVKRDMTGPDGLFYSAQDSEVDTHEGKSYVWAREEIERVLSKDEAALARRVYGLDVEPNFDGRYILHWPRMYEETAKRENLSVAQLMQRLAPIRAKLLAARNQRQQPHRDDKSITAWNGHMIWALAYAGDALGRKEYVAMATRAADAKLKTLRDEQGQLLHVARHGKAKLDAYLDDYAATILAFMELGCVTRDARWRVEAANLADAMIARLWDPAGGFHYAPATVANLIVRTKDSYDGPVPAGNSLAVRALIALAKNGNPRYAGYAAATLRAYGSLLNEAPRALPYMLWGVADYRQARLVENAVPPAKTAAIPTTADLVVLQATLSDGILHPDKDVTLNVVLTVQKDWHVNANPASLDFLVPTTVDAKAEQAELRVAPDYPRGRLIDAGLGSEKIAVYAGRIEIPARLTVVRASPGRSEGALAVLVRAQACNDAGRCLSPATLRTTLPVRFERQ